jgi:hypothetical protein
MEIRGLFVSNSAAADVIVLTISKQGYVFYVREHGISARLENYLDSGGKKCCSIAPMELSFRPIS